MDTYELMELMEGVGGELDEQTLQKIDSFLAFSCRVYKPACGGREMSRRIDWQQLNTSHLREEFGTDCRRMNMALERLEQGENHSRISTEFHSIRCFLEDGEFRRFCFKSLEELQREAQSLLEKDQNLTRSRSSREIESGRESFEDMKEIYHETKRLQKKAEEYAQAADEHLRAVDQMHQETKKFQEKAERYAQAADEHSKAVDQMHQETKKFQEKAEEYAQAADEHLKAVNQLQKRTAQFKRDALNAQHAAESIIPNMLTTLGVFIAIVVAVVGCYLSLIFNKHQNPDFPVLNLSVCLLMGHILLNVIFLLMYLISKLTNYSMACHCHIVSQADCSICPAEVREKCRLPNRIWLRYPYVILLNGIFLVCYLALALWSFLRHYLGRQIDQVLYDQAWLVLLLAIALAALFVCALWIACCLLSPNKELKKAIKDHAGRPGLTEEEQELERQVSKLSERVESIEALYAGQSEQGEKSSTHTLRVILPETWKPGV